jgi:CHAT domain
VLAGELSAVGRVVHGLELAEWWLRVGRADRCDLALARLREKPGALPTAVLGSARIEAQIRRQSGDRSGGLRRLAEAVAATAGQPATDTDRAQAAIQLIACWPVTPGTPERPFHPEDVQVGGRGLPGWCAEAQRWIGAVPSWAQNSLRVSLLAVLHGIGAADEAAALSAVTDLAAFASQSAGYSEWSGDIEAWMERRSADERGDEAPPGPAGQTYADLAEAGQIPEAAAAADALAERQERRGFRADAYDTLIWSARLHTALRDFAAALRAYEHAFALLEYDLQFMPYAELVVGRLAAWPDLYQQAAVTALLAGDPARALALAETGRARATSGRLGRAHAARPAMVTAGDWLRFAQLWRRAVAETAGGLLAAGEPAQDPGEPGGAAASTAELNQLRRAFLAAGVPPEDLAPVAPPADITGLPVALARAQHPTAVLYPIQIHNLADPGRGTIRFVRAAGSGITEIALDPTTRSEIARVIDQFGADVRATPADADPSWLEARLADLVRDLGPHLEPVLSLAVTGIEDGRLIWIPPGAAAGVPIQALPCQGGQLIDLVSVIVAPSLRSVADAALQDVAQPLRGVVIEGTADPGQAKTEGGDRVMLDAGPVPPVSRPATLADLNAAVARGTLVYLSCHGHFRWGTPLTSTLQLGADSRHRFDLRVADIFDAAELPADALVLLGACDSGTIAQTSLNEGIGVPAAFLAAGARAVIGAGWPVSRAVAVGVSLKFVQALRAGSASPEALRQAVRWIRDATIADLDQELAAVGHPLHSTEPPTEAQAVLRRRRAFAGLSSWAAYLHWGGGWRAEQPGADGRGPGEPGG